MKELTINVRAKDVLKRLEKHRARYQKTLKLLFKSFEREAQKYQEEYQKFVAEVQRLEKQPYPPNKPEDRTKDYDFYIAMLKEHILEVVTLSEEMFRTLWQDRWDWTSQHHDTMMFYAQAGGAGSADIAELASAYDD